MHWKTLPAVMFAFLLVGNVSSVTQPALTAPQPPAQAQRQTVAPTDPAPVRRLFPLVVTPTPPPTSEELIDQALARGTIAAETVLIDKVYVAFSDPRLPAQYRGAHS